MKRRMNLKSIATVVGLLAALVIAGQSFAAKQAPAAPVNVNTASVEQLMEIPGIGASKAQAIAAHRATGPFASTSDLTNVRGIGEKLLAKIAPYVTVGGKAQSKPGTAGKAK